MKDVEYEELDDDKPPMLGGVDAQDEDNQAAEQSTIAAGDESIMDEMMAVAQRAKEAKHKQQHKERNHKSFGQGLKKGFFNSSGTKKKTKTLVKSAAMLEPTQQQTREERLLIVKPNEEKSPAAEPTFVFPEVQEAMKSMNQLDPKEWMNERFFEKLARNPKLAQALQNPAFSTAIAEMQQDPRAAVLKYQKDPAVSTMLRDFMEFLGNHFEELGASSEAANATNQSPQQQQKHGDPLQGIRAQRGNSTASAPKSPAPPAIVDLDDARRQAIAGMKHSPEEEAQVQRILQSPELLNALSDATLMQRLHTCQQSPQQLQRLAQDPVLGPKLRLLVQHNLVQFAS
ncbi:hypothetical protein BBP00_00008483 [Phytophthora kernoviae]|uniref:STI1 domain-containing protein n=1 Tax=Phytophthora kernoviae TaxID=325452 RepID=A0A3F2RGT7_9STRA|nr:hypothetical protein BBP00_00008483 [Phytophthora kernoviae]